MTNDRKHIDHTSKWHRRLFAVLTVLFLILVLPVSLNAAEAAADDDRAPTVTDWGVFDVTTNRETSMLNDGTLRQDSSGTTLYIRFNHNVAGEQLQENNLSKISVVSGSGQPVEAEVWVKSTATEFQYRQYIFVTLAKNLNPEKGYQIVIAPGLKANNTFVNETGDTLFFAYAGTSGEEAKPPSEEEETKPQEEEPGKTSDEEQKTEPQKEEQTKEPQQEKQTTGSGKESAQTGNGGNSSGNAGSAGSGSSAGAEVSRGRNFTPNTASISSASDDIKNKHSRVQKLSDTAAASLRGAAVYDPSAEGEEAASGQDNGPDMLTVILAMIALIEAGVLTELKSFDIRLQKRSRKA